MKSEVNCALPVCFADYQGCHAFGARLLVNKTIFGARLLIK